MPEPKKLENNSTEGRYISSGIRKLMKKSNDPYQAKINTKITPEQELEKQKQAYYKIMTATMKYQTPDDPADTGQIAQTYASLTQTEQSIKIGQKIDKLVDVFKGTKLSRSMQYHGKNITFDTSMKSFNGDDPVVFNYQIKGNEQNKPPGASLISSIIISNGRGLEVYRTKGASKLGRHNYTWNGTDERGKILEEGDYFISVESAWEYNLGDQKISVPLESGGFDSGFVDEVRSKKDGEAVLIVNGLEVDPEQILVVNKDAPKIQKPKISDYSNYIGKNAVISNSDVKISSGKGEISFKTDIDFPGKAKIKLFDSTGNLSSITIVDNVKTGINNILINPYDCYTNEEAFEVFEKQETERKPIKDGIYSYEIFLEDTLSTSNDKFVKLDIAREVKITGLDFSSEELEAVCGSEKFPVKSIVKMSSETSNHSSLFTDGANYLGKIAKVEKNTIYLNNNDVYKSITLDKLEDGEKYLSLNMRIFDEDGTLVREISKDDRSILVHDSKVFDNNLLYDYISERSKEKLLRELGIYDSSQKLPENIFELQTYIRSVNDKKIIQERSRNTEIDLMRQEDFNSSLIPQLGTDQTEEERRRLIESRIMRLEDLNASSVPSSSSLRLVTLEDVKSFLSNEFYKFESPSIESEKLYSIEDYNKIINNFDSLPESEKESLKIAISRNDPINVFKWDGKDASGRKLKDGNYSFEIVVLKQNSNGVMKKEKISASEDYYIKEFKVDSGRLKFVCMGVNYDESSNSYNTNDDLGEVIIPQEHIVSLRSL